MKHTTTRHYPDPIDGPYVLAITEAVIDGRLECVGVTVSSDTSLKDLAPVTTSSLRIPLNDILSRIRTPLHPLFDHTQYKRTTMDEIKEAKKTTDTIKAGPGRPPLAASHYASVARTYRLAHSQGLPPTKAVSQRFCIGKSTAAKRIARARDLGLLGPATKGKPGEATR